MSRVFANGPGDRVSIPGQVIPKTKKIVLDSNLLNTQHYKVRIKGKVEQSTVTHTSYKLNDQHTNRLHQKEPFLALIR